MVMRFALWEMRLSGNCPRRTPREMTYLIRLVFLQHSPFYINDSTRLIFTVPVLFVFLTCFQAMAEDKSNEWFAKHNRQKAAA